MTLKNIEVLYVFHVVTCPIEQYSSHRWSTCFLAIAKTLPKGRKLDDKGLVKSSKILIIHFRDIAAVEAILQKRLKNVSLLSVCLVCVDVAVDVWYMC